MLLALAGIFGGRAALERALVEAALERRQPDHGRQRAVDRDMIGIEQHLERAREQIALIGQALAAALGEGGGADAVDGSSWGSALIRRA